MKNGILVLIGLILFSCSDKNENKSEKIKRYIISSENKKEKKRLSEANIPPPPAPPISFYGPNNLIFDSHGDFYYYQRYNSWACTANQSDTIPYFIDLDPIQLVKIPRESVEKFISENLSHLEHKRRILIIGSKLDTITDENFLRVVEFLGNNIPAWLIRKTTHEEDMVLKAKINNDYYSPDSIKWDSTKIKFLKHQLD